MSSNIRGPWLYDINWTTYLQLEGKLKLYFVCNPEFPGYVGLTGILPDTLRIQIAPKSHGHLEWNQGLNNGQGGNDWVWNDGALLDVDIILPADKLLDGKPTIWEFEPNSGEQYCVYVVTSSSKVTNYMYTYNFFTMPELRQTPSTPVMSGNNIEVTVNDSNASITALEFHNTSSPPEPWSNYSDATRALFFEVACQQTESVLEYKYHNYKKFKIWSKENHTIGVNFMVSVSEEMRETFKAYVQQAVDIVNDTVGSSGFSLTIIDGKTDGTYEDITARNGLGEIQLWWGSYEELWDTQIPSGWRYFGEWYNNDTSDDPYITEGWIKLCTDTTWTMNLPGITWEEIIECLGIGNDINHDVYSTFSDYWFPAKNLDQYGGILVPDDMDLDVLRMAYNHDLPSDIEPWDCANRIYAPNGYFYNMHHKDYNGSPILFDVSNLNVGDTYTFKAISLDNNNSSCFTDAVNYTITTDESNILK